MCSPFIREKNAVNSNFKIFPEINAFVLYFSGITHVEDIIAIMKQVIKDPSFKPSMTCIADYRKTCLLIDANDIQQYIDFAKNDPLILSKRKVAMIITTPQQINHGKIYREMLTDYPMDVEVFNTLDSGLDWIGVSVEHLNKVNMFLLGQVS
jgi:hypothetical protein